MSESALSIQPRKTSQEIAASASAALAKATIEAKFVIALQRPRSIMTARSAILDACKRPAFAEGAMYRKKQGSKQVNGRWEDNYIEGLSIRFAEQALNAWRNVDVTAVTAWEDENARLIRITVTDLETNLSYSDEAMLQKTVERKKVRDGQDVIGERETSDGGKVFIVRTTDEEMANKVNAAKSKAIRNSGLRLIPQDILEEAEEAIRATKEKGGGDPKAQVKKVVDAFGGIGVPPNEIESYLGHSIEQASPKEIVDLRSIFTTIRDGEARWTDYRTKEEPKSVEVKVAGSESITRNTAPPEGASDNRGEGSAEAASAPRTPPQQDPQPNPRLVSLRKWWADAGIQEGRAMEVIHQRFPETQGCNNLEEVEQMFPNILNAISRPSSRPSFVKWVGGEK